MENANIPVPLLSSYQQHEQTRKLTLTKALAADQVTHTYSGGPFQLEFNKSSRSGPGSTGDVVIHS